jgi:hypothetical protein
MNQAGSRGRLTLCSDFLLGLLFSPEDGGDISLKNWIHFQKELSMQREILLYLLPVSYLFLA